MTLTAAAAAREGARLRTFAGQLGVPSDSDAVLLYLVHLLDVEGLNGPRLRARLALLDKAAATTRRTPPSALPSVQQFLRGLHREALLGPTGERQPLYLEDIQGMLDALQSDFASQARDVALLLLVNATGLCAWRLLQLSWNDVRFRRHNVELLIHDRGDRRRRVQVVDGTTWPRTVQTLRQHRRQAGAVPGPAFRIAAKRARAMVAAHLHASELEQPARVPRPEHKLETAIQILSAPTAIQQRNLALLSLGFAACLTAGEARNLRQAQVKAVPQGLLIDLPGRRHPAAAVPFAAGRHCPVKYWQQWSARQPSDPAALAFPAIHKSSQVADRRLGITSLTHIVTETAAMAGLDQEYGWTSLRVGLLRSAIRVDAHPALLLQQAHIGTVSGLERHVRRERRITHSVAGRVGL